MKSDNEFRRGLIDGIPIGLAYVAVSFAFGISGASKGIPVWALTLISATCVTSAGQFAAVITMTAGGSLVELVLSQIIINLRYSIMSIAIGQKLSEKSTLWNRISHSDTKNQLLDSSSEIPPPERITHDAVRCFPEK